MATNAEWFCLIEGVEVENPVSSGQIKKWLIDGTLSVTDKIRKEDGEWKEISQFPKLVDTVESAATPSDDDGIKKTAEGSVVQRKARYAEWVPESLVSYTNLLEKSAISLTFFIAMMFMLNKPDDISWIVSTLVTVVAIVTVSRVRKDATEGREKLLRGDGCNVLAMNIGMGVLLFVTQLGGLAVYANGTIIGILVGIVIQIVGAIYFGPWFYFVYQYGEHFKERDLDGEVKKRDPVQEAEGMVVVAISCLITAGLAGFVAYGLGSIVIGIAIHLLSVVVFGPWLYFPFRYGKQYEWTWKRDVFRMKVVEEDGPLQKADVVTILKYVAVITCVVGICWATFGEWNNGEATVQAHVPHLSQYTRIEFQQSEQDNSMLFLSDTERILHAFSEFCGVDLLHVVRDDKDIFIRDKVVLVDVSEKPAVIHGLTGRLNSEIRTNDSSEIGTVIWLTSLPREGGGSAKEDPAAVVDCHLLFIDIKQGTLFGIETITGKRSPELTAERPPELTEKLIRQRIEKRLRSTKGESATCPHCNDRIKRGDQRCNNCGLTLTEMLNTDW